jgi:hypothetical protein
MNTPQEVGDVDHRKQGCRKKTTPKAWFSYHSGAPT